MPPSISLSSVWRILGVFAYHARWIHWFSDKIQPLENIKSFVLESTAFTCFRSLKRDLRLRCFIWLMKMCHLVSTVMRSKPPWIRMGILLRLCLVPYRMVVDTILQWQRKVWPSLRWSLRWCESGATFSSRKHLTLVTDYCKFEVYMFNSWRCIKIKNNKIQEWWPEHQLLTVWSSIVLDRTKGAKCPLSMYICVSFDCSSWPAQELVSSRNHTSALFSKSKNLPMYREEAKIECGKCGTCLKVKPHSLQTLARNTSQAYLAHRKT